MAWAHLQIDIQSLHEAPLAPWSPLINVQWAWNSALGEFLVREEGRSSRWWVGVQEQSFFVMTLSACLSFPRWSLRYKELTGHSQGRTLDSKAHFGKDRNLTKNWGPSLFHHHEGKIQGKSVDTKCITYDIYDLVQCHLLDVWQLNRQDRVLLLPPFTLFIKQVTQHFNIRQHDMILQLQ